MVMSMVVATMSFGRDDNGDGTEFVFLF